MTDVQAETPELGDCPRCSKPMSENGMTVGVISSAADGQLIHAACLTDTELAERYPSPPDPTADALAAALAELERLRAKVEAVEALHHVEERRVFGLDWKVLVSEWCAHCGVPAPCQTRAALASHDGKESNE